MSTSEKNSESKSDNAGLRFIVLPIFLLAIVVTTLLCISQYQISHVVKHARAVFENTPQYVAVIGYALGEKFDVRECPVEDSPDSTMHYSYILPVKCFKHLEIRDAGKPLTGAQLVWIEQADLASNYPNIGMSNVLCAAVVDGNLEGLYLTLHTDDGVEAGARNAFEGQVVESESRFETDTLRYHFRRLNWNVRDVDIQMIESSAQFKPAGRSGGFRYAVIAYTPLAAGLLASEWDSPQSRCDIR